MAWYFILAETKYVNVKNVQEATTEVFFIKIHSSFVNSSTQKLRNFGAEINVDMGKT